MDWTQVWTVLGVTAGLFLSSVGTTITLFVWNRSESRNDFRNLESASRNDFRNLESALNSNLLAIREEVMAIHNEMKDFHGRLCAIEEKNKRK